MRRAAAFLLAVLAFAGPAAAQTPAFQSDLLRLSEIMGALSHLEAICGHADHALWRDRMARLIDAQAMAPPDRQLYVGAFNQGFDSFANIHRSCTPQARTIIERYLAEGGGIAARIGAGYGLEGAPPSQ
jgi:uncharacterized protein (TIGR02301 family)